MPRPEELICSCGGPKSRQAPRCAKCSGKGHTPEQRDRLSTPMCGVRKKNGEACRAFSGQGTDHLGFGPCRFHGGNTINHRKHAVAVEARKRMITLGTPIENITAPEALMGLLRASSGHVAWIQQEVAGLDSLAGHEAQVLVRLYDDERTMLVRVSEACVRAGVAEHIVKMEQARAEMTVRAIRDAAGDAGLTPTQIKALGAALRTRLAAANGDEPEGVDRLAELRAQVASEDEQRVSKLAERRARELSGLTFPPSEWARVEPSPAE